MSRWQKNLLKYGVTSVVGLLLVRLYFLMNLDSMSDFAAVQTVEKYRMLCDAFTVPGIVILMVGFLVSLSNGGAFNGVGYVVSFAVRSLIPGMGGHEKYNEYLERKNGKRVTGYGFLYVVGGVFLGIALIFIALYYNA